MVSKRRTVPKTKNYQDYHVFCKNNHGRVKIVFLMKEFATVGSGITFSYIWMLKNLNQIFLYLSKFKNFRSKNSNVIKMKNLIWITKTSPFFHLDRYYLFLFFFSFFRTSEEIFITRTKVFGTILQELVAGMDMLRVGSGPSESFISVWRWNPVIWYNIIILELVVFQPLSHYHWTFKSSPYVNKDF